MESSILLQNFKRIALKLKIWRKVSIFDVTYAHSEHSIQKKQDCLFRCSIALGNFPLELPKKSCSVYYLMGFSGKLFVNGKQPLFPNCPRLCNPWTWTSSTCNFCCCFSFSAERIDCHKIITFELVGSQAWFYDKIPSVCPKGPAHLICEMGDWRQAAMAHLQSLTLED